MKTFLIAFGFMCIVMASVFSIVGVMSKSYEPPIETNPSCEIYRNTEFYKLPARCVKEYIAKP